MVLRCRSLTTRKLKKAAKDVGRWFSKPNSVFSFVMLARDTAYCWNMCSNRLLHVCKFGGR